MWSRFKNDGDSNDNDARDVAENRDEAASAAVIVRRVDASSSSLSSSFVSTVVGSDNGGVQECRCSAELYNSFWIYAFVMGDQVNKFSDVA